MINTFKPQFRLLKHNKQFNDILGIHINICNEISFYLTIFGYGFMISILIRDVLKLKEELK